MEVYMEKTKKNLCRLMGILLAAGLMLPTPVQAAQSTARVANDPIDISTLKVGYDLRDENDSTIWSKDGTVEYQGKPITIDGYLLKDNCLLPRESYSLSIEGDNVKKTLVKDGYSEKKYIYNDHSYGFEDEADYGTILYGSLLPVYQAGKRLGFKREHPCNPFLVTFMGIEDKYTLEQLRQYDSMTEFVNKTGYMQSDEIAEGPNAGYISKFENTALDEAKRWGYNDLASYHKYLCDREEYARCEPVNETWYPMYFIISKDLVTREQVDTVAKKRNYEVYETSNEYYIYGNCTYEYADYMDYNVRMIAPQIANELNLDRNQVNYSYAPEQVVVYHTYYSFTDRQLIDAIAAEMDTWSGRWDYYLYGDAHFQYHYDWDEVRKPGYGAGNWGAGFGLIQDQITVNYAPEYKYTITGPGRVTVKITGREDQNGHGSANVKGTSVAYLDVIQKPDKSLNGVLKTNDGNWYYYVNGEIQKGQETVKKNDYGWWYIGTDGKVDFHKNTVAKNEHGWWVIQNGKVNFNYNGIAGNAYGDWYCQGGKVNFGANGVLKTPQGWYYVREGKVQTGTETVQKNSYGWWYIGIDGKVDFNKNTVAKNSYGWWAIQNGKVNFNYTGIAHNSYGYWYCYNGRVDFSARTLCKYNGTWWYINKGKVDFDSGELLIPYGKYIWYVNNGRMTNFQGWIKALPCNGSWYVIRGNQNHILFYEFFDKNGADTTQPYNGVISVGQTYYWAVNSKIDFSIGTTPKPTEAEKKAAEAQGIPVLEGSPSWRYFNQYTAQSQACRQKVKKYDYIWK